MSTIHLNRKCSKVIAILSEVAQMFSEIPVVTRQKCYAFDSENVGRRNIVVNKYHKKFEKMFQMTFVSRESP